MKRMSILATILVASLPVSAHAAQLINEDNAPYTVTVTAKTGSVTVNVDPESVIEDICDSCTIALGENSVAAKGEDAVFIRKGKLEIGD
ncbi:MAG: hypothetical protein OQJ99_00910 [Rhodospirillales bacterium]|nr:hypothetical protein [Rhodospirillales bacterium]MCW8862517.1 hypothetical protein [Rhodospirillales bacterium]MCW8953138.1 hypothetical protein [Rhodospirillales bacterium]MCW8970123.1 hypothetical protein [Rhodospirillales bacterium]MCW9002362.1 hypothetical protein [Rhodospirillales bacterium]